MSNEQNQLSEISDNAPVYFIHTVEVDKTISLVIPRDGSMWLSWYSYISADNPPLLFSTPTVAQAWIDTLRGTGEFRPLYIRQWRGLDDLRAWPYIVEESLG